MSALPARLARYAPQNHGALVSGAEARIAPRDQPSAEQLRALQHVDIVLTPEEVDLEGRMRRGRFSEATSHSDDLRLPPPPRPRGAGTSLAQAAARPVAQFESKASQPVGVDAATLVAEGRMMTLLAGIGRLQATIDQQRQKEQAA